MEIRMKRPPFPDYEPLPFDTAGREPWLKNRISRCFSAPIKRPPFFRDELLDDIDYYPENYLKLLASEGINGLWITVSFREICRDTPAAAQRQAKLRKVVERCARHGIGIWVFAIEPAGWSADNPLPPGLEELAGPSAYGKWQSFCAKPETAAAYLHDATYHLFSRVAGLAGLITISLGERITSCLSCTSVYGEGDIPCPRRCDLQPHEIISRILTSMRAGIRDAAPEAEMISWFYMPHSDQAAEWIYQLEKGVPEDVIMACNFESGCARRQMGKMRVGGDYWLSCVGPGERFARLAALRRGHGDFAAKIQAGCSHELATVPLVPVPGQLYRKYRIMRDLGVRHVLQCWFFGNHPGLMNRAAGMLAYEDFTDGETGFLTRLARPEWGENAARMAEVWTIFAAAYENYPLDIQFQYYGPIHDGPVWPLHLYPAHRPLPRSWKPETEPAGDAIGECLVHFTLNEAATLTGRMAAKWSEGVEKMRAFADGTPDFLLARAIGILFRSGYNILRFYSLRARWLDGDAGVLGTLAEIVREEQANSLELAELCRRDPRLGYHSEAEVYKFYPEKLEWRAAALRELLDREFREQNPPEAPSVETGRWYGAANFRWRADNTAEDLFLRIECAGEREADRECVRLYFMDRHMLKTPWWDFCIWRDDMPPEDSYQRQTPQRERRVGVEDILQAAGVVKTENGDSWNLEITIPRYALDGDACFLFGIQRECRSMPFSNYPPGEYRQEDRLFLSYFSPEKLILLKLRGSES